MKRLSPPIYTWQHPNWPHFTWQSDALLSTLGQARLAQGKLLQSGVGLSLHSNKDSQAEVLVQEAVTTSAIEGEKIDLETVRSSVARRLGLPSAKSSKSDRHIEGLVDVLQDASQQYMEPLTIERLYGWHAALFPTGYSGFHKIQVGQWRAATPMQVVSGAIGKERVHYEAPPSDQLPTQMKQFVKWWNEESKSMDGLLRAGVAHFYFETIHPFDDGNGRLGRALIEMALAQDEKLATRLYSMSARIFAERNAYYDALERNQKNGLDITDWLLWFLQCFTNAIKDSEKIVETVLLKSQFWQRHAQVHINERQRKVINRLLDAGPNGFIGGMTTRKYTSMTSSSRATAFREISDLVEKKILLPNEGSGRNVAYELNWTGDR